MSSHAEFAAPGGKWTGGVQGVVLDCPVGAAWELCSDWTHWQRWWPGNAKFGLREGENRKPSCLRYVELVPGVRNYERLLDCDDEKRFLSYRLEENQLGWKGYGGKAQFRATEDGKTVVDWNYEVDAMEGNTAEMMSIRMQVFYNRFLKDLEKAAQRLANGLDPKPEDATEADTAQ